MRSEGGAVLTRVVVIPTRNRANNLVKLLASLGRQTCPPDLVIVVDSSSPTNMNANLQTLLESCLEFKHVPSLGMASHQRNVGIGLALAVPRLDVLHLFDDDVQLDSEYVELVEDCLLKNARVVAVGGRNRSLVDWRPRTLKRLIGLDSRRSGAITWTGLNVQPQGPHEADVDWLSGCALSVRGAICGDLRYRERPWSIDERRGLVGQDVNVCLDLRKRGALRYLPAATYWHEHSEIGRNDALTQGRMTTAYRWDLARRRVPPFRLARVVLGVVTEATVSIRLGGGDDRAAYGKGLLIGLIDVIARRRGK